MIHNLNVLAAKSKIQLSIIMEDVIVLMGIYRGMNNV